MNHAGEIRPLARMVRPHIAIITNVLPVHVGNFPDGEIGVAKAKAEIFEGLVPGGTAIILRDSPHFELLSTALEATASSILSFGTRSDCDACLAAHGATAPGAPALQSVTAAFRDGRRITLPLGMQGAHIATNALAVLLALTKLDIDLERAIQALATVSAAPGRGLRMTLRADGGTLLLLDESYNANPASMRAALDNLANTSGPTIRRRVAVLGDMLELGEKAVKYHVDLGPDARVADLVFACGPNMKHLYDGLDASRRGAWAPSSDGLIEPVLAALQAGDVVMVKGSLGSRMAPIVDAIKKRFTPEAGTV